jgi:hypothetical protein
LWLPRITKRIKHAHQFCTHQRAHQHQHRFLQNRYSHLRGPCSIQEKVRKKKKKLVKFRNSSRKPETTVLSSSTSAGQASDSFRLTLVSSCLNSG